MSAFSIKRTLALIVLNVCFPAKAGIEYPIKNPAENEPVDSLYTCPPNEGFCQATLLDEVKHNKATVEQFSEQSLVISQYWRRH